MLMYSKGTDRGAKTMGLMTAWQTVTYSVGLRVGGVGVAHQNTQHPVDNKKRIRSLM